MTDRKRQEYELALRTGERRFGSVCKHDKVKDGHCMRCLRRVIIKGG